MGCREAVVRNDWCIIIVQSIAHFLEFNLIDLVKMQRSQVGVKEGQWSLFCWIILPSNLWPLKVKSCAPMPLVIFYRFKCSSR